MQGVAVEAQLWRCGNHAKVWYEWCTTAPQVRCAAHACAARGADCVRLRNQVSPVHNTNGRSYFVGL